MVYLVNEETGPLQGSGFKKIDVADDYKIIVAQFQRRRLAALRCEPLEDGRRDPIDFYAESLPSSFALNRWELEAEVERLLGSAWESWEIRARLVDPRKVAA